MMKHSMMKPLLVVLGFCAVTQARASDFIFFNGFEQFQPPVPGSVIFTEIMSNPTVVPDADGEWFELKNLSEQILNLGDCTVAGSGGSPNALPQFVFTAGNFAVVARNADMGANGGVDAFAAFTFSLAASGTLTLTCDGSVIDTVSWSAESAGNSRNLDEGHFSAIDNDNPANWCYSTIAYNNGDTGSPGSVNEQCPAR
jgi:hypothetical protein